MTDQPRGSGFSTLAIHAGLRANALNDALHIADVADHAGEASPGDVEALAAIRSSGCPSSTAALEERLAALEGGSAAVAVATGASAQVLTFHTLLLPGDEIVSARRPATPPYRWPFDSFGWKIRAADPDKPESFVEALSDKTKAIFIESMAQPNGAITDIEAIATIARRARVPLIVDNTLATPYLVRPFEHGADIVLHATTRLLAGQSGSDGGIIVDGGVFDWLEDDRYPSISRRRSAVADASLGEIYGNFGFAVACREMALHGLGPTLPPRDATVVLNGIETLGLRMQRQADSALAVGQHLARHSSVTWVRYAGLVDDPAHELAQRYCPRGAGVLVSFGLSSGNGSLAGFVDRLRLFSGQTESGSTRSSIIKVPTANGNGKQQPQLMGQGPNTILVSIGLEDTADIIADLDRALGA